MRRSWNTIIIPLAIFCLSIGYDKNTASSLQEHSKNNLLCICCVPVLLLFGTCHSLSLVYPWCIVLKKVYSKLSKPMSELNLPSVRRRYYPVKTKLSAVRDRVINEMGYAEVLSKYEVKPSTFHVWLHKYKSRVLSEEQHKRLSSRNYKMLYPMTDQERAELETLRQEVEKQKILVEAYELMLELARERLHVDVKKNYEEMLLAGLSRDRKNGEVKP